MDLIARLRDLASNLYWTWRPDMVEIFRDLDPQIWRETNHNPVAFLNRIDGQTIHRKAASLALEARISQAFHQMQDYLEAGDAWGDRHAGALHSRPVAYFSAEFGLHESLPIYSGGLGVLSGDHLKSASDLGVPLVGVGLFYAEGYFEQTIDAEGWQQEHYAQTDLDQLPLRLTTNGDDEPLTVRVATRSREISARIWTAHVGRNRLLLLDSHCPENSDEDCQLTAQLYGGNERTRILQELILGVGGLRALKAMGIRPSVVHLNEGHSAFAVLELARGQMRRDARRFADVRDDVARRTVFTTHTPVAAGHDRFGADLVEETLGPLREKLEISPEQLMGLGRVRPDDGDEPFCMTVLGLRMAHMRNAVSSRHARVSRRMWQDVWPSLPLDMVPIGHITNGVHVDSWLAVPMAPLYERYLGPQWQEHMHESSTWEAIDRIDNAEFWEQHQVLNAHLIEYVHRRLADQARHRGEDPDQIPRFDPNALTIGFARRFAPYKRAGLLLTDMDRLQALCNAADRPVQFIFAGKAHPDNRAGKEMIQRLFHLSLRDDRFRGRLAFLEGYDMNVARHLVQGADVWLNTPRRPYEACGTSGQKIVLNGGLNLSTLDGWWAEAYDARNGFAIGEGGEHSDPEAQDARDAEALYRTLEEQVVPLFYDRDDRGVPHGWIERQKHAVGQLPWRFSARRMVRDYTLRCYLPAAGVTTTSRT